MAILVISEYVFSEQNSTGYYWSRIIEHLNHVFDESIVVTPEDQELEGERERLENVTYAFLSKPRIKVKGTASKIAFQILLTLKFMYFVIAKVSKNDIVLTGTNPPTILLAIAFLKQFKKFKWQLLVHDVFPENFVPAKVIKKDSFIYRILNYLFNRAYSCADETSVIGRDMKELLQRKISGKREISYIPNWIELEKIFPVELRDSKYCYQNNEKGDVTFQFFGNIGRLQGIDNLLNAIKRVKSKKAKFVFMGRGPYLKNLTDFITRNPKLPINYLGEVSGDDKNLALSSCDVALVTLEKGMYGLGVPSKSYFSMAADKPLLVVAHEFSEISRVVSEYNIGWACQEDNPDVLANIIDKICENSLLQKVNSSRTVLENNFSESICMKKFINLTQKLIKE
jgi:glycosyltransferase involved in cell wall biosynthesis